MTFHKSLEQVNLLMLFYYIKVGKRAGNDSLYLGFTKVSSIPLISIK